jgi:hypothetical protein
MDPKPRSLRINPKLSQRSPGGIAILSNANAMWPWPGGAAGGLGGDARRRKDNAERPRRAHARSAARHGATPVARGESSPDITIRCAHAPIRFFCADDVLRSSLQVISRRPRSAIIGASRRQAGAGLIILLLI